MVFPRVKSRTSTPAGSRYVGSAALVIFVMGGLGAGVAGAQQLWSVENAGTRSASSSASTGGLARVASAVRSEAEVRAAPIRARFDYLRLGAGYLELPLPDGVVMKAENAVFEDRGDGNVMWTGEVPGAGYESVLFTVQDGHLVGWFGEPGGPKYLVHAGPDGRGSLTVETGPVGDWCGVEAGPEGALRGSRRRWRRTTPWPRPPGRALTGSTSCCSTRAARSRTGACAEGSPSGSGNSPTT